jgi:hypothetical protein
MQPPSSSTIALLALLPLLGWRVYARFRRAVGRQHLSSARPWITLTIFSILVVFLAYAAHTHVERLWWLAAGLSAGTLLALYGLRMTRFEPTPQGLFYTPNAYLGIAMSLLFLGRIVYRLFEVYAIRPEAFHGPSDFARSPLTLMVFGLIAGYYIAYSIGLVRWRYRVLQAERPLEALAGDA